MGTPEMPGFVSIQGIITILQDVEPGLIGPDIPDMVDVNRGQSANVDAAGNCRRKGANPALLIGYLAGQGGAPVPFVCEVLKGDSGECVGYRHDSADC